MIDETVAPANESGPPLPRPWPREMLPIFLTAMLLLAAFFVAEPTIRFLCEPPRRQIITAELRWSQLVQHRTLEAISLAWFFMLGASVGSFVHCVEYRWPRRISVVARGSACPGCNTPIRLWHNVPVFGWLWLRGRCARCGWDIPARYAITELVFGTVFVLLMSLELVGGGINLPLVRTDRPLGVMENIWSPHWRLIGFYVYHVSLLTFLLTYCLFVWDRFRLPTSLVLLATLAGIALPIVWPVLLPVGWDGMTDVFSLDPRLRVVLGLIVGGIAGLVLGGCLLRRRPGNIRASDAAGAILGMALVGLYLGWQAAIAVAAIAVAVRGLFLFSSARNWPVVASITLATALHLAAWSWLVRAPIYPGLHGYLMTCGMLAVVAMAARLLDGWEHGGDAGPTMIAEKGAPEFVPETSPSANNDGADWEQVSVEEPSSDDA